jgi:hypothetical protein
MVARSTLARAKEEDAVTALSAVRRRLPERRPDKKALAAAE